MKAKVVSLTVALAMAALPSIVSACDMKIGLMFMGIPSAGFNLGGGVNVLPGDDHTFTTFNVDASFALGERAVLTPGIGLCTGGDESEVVFGGGAGFNVWNNADGSVAVNVQGALTYLSYDGGSEQGIPVTGVAHFGGSGSASFYAGAGLYHYRVSYDTGSEFFDIDGSTTDPMLMGGAMFGSSVDIMVGASLVLGDDSDFAFGAGVSLPVGG